MCVKNSNSQGKTIRYAGSKPRLGIKSSQVYKRTVTFICTVIAKRNLEIDINNTKRNEGKIKKKRKEENVGNFQTGIHVRQKSEPVYNSCIRSACMHRVLTKIGNCIFFFFFFMEKEKCKRGSISFRKD